MPIRHWRLYADHHVAPLRRSRIGAITAIGDTEYVGRLIGTAKSIPNLKLIIIDPASRFRGGNENDARDATRFVEACELVARKTGAAVLVLHHTNKGSMAQGADQTQAAARGSSAFTDGVRWQMNLATLTKEEASTAGIPEDQRFGYLSARVTKNNYAPPQLAPVFLKRTEYGYLQKVELQRESASGTALWFEVLRRIGQSDGAYSAKSFIAEFGGTKNALKAGEKAVRGAITKCRDDGLIEDGTKLTLTPKGRGLLSALTKRSTGGSVKAGPFLKPLPSQVANGLHRDGWRSPPSIPVSMLPHSKEWPQWIL
jgi:hypothetical protein